MEMNITSARSNPSVLIKMEAAINAHDIDAFVLYVRSFCQGERN